MKDIQNKINGKEKQQEKPKVICTTSTELYKFINTHIYIHESAQTHTHQMTKSGGVRRKLTTTIFILLHTFDS